MDDLETLRDSWGQPEPPSAAAYSAARAALLERQAAAPGPVRRRRAGWWSGGIGLTAAAAAVAVVVAASGAGAPNAPHGAAAGAQLSARQILLAAATTAQAQPTGTYWHVKVTWELNPNPGAEAGAVAQPKWINTQLPNGKSERIRTRPGYDAQVNVITGKVRWVREVPVPPEKNLKVANSTFESWIAKNGNYWAPPACPKQPGTVIFNAPDGTGVGGLTLSDGDLTYERAEKLPTAPAALTAWLAKYETTSGTLAQALITLLYAVPAPPEIRAAAFRALAAFPGAKSLGPVHGGQSLEIPFPGQVPSSIKLVVNPATSLVSSETTFKGTIAVTTAGWTSQLPKVVPLGSKSACLPGH
jgi:hypothetical protein